MSARTPTRTRAIPAPVSALRAGHGSRGAGAGRGAGGAAARLPWWAVALPAAAFAVLFLLAGSGQARATGGEPAIGRFLDHVRYTVTR
ncbi:hypothetical protein [Streptomyces sudanensis]|uniref:hypothetical protein n=1 Tax=Streptomyces sudanensis TaxID=436397 RepID=UPI0020CBBF2B|nr:hypothetical protein [Streptomyces sudanensis]MCP9959490.1 hypothetical protein [Streptomyces sudanensis]MCP9988554.1 hypothetical protein [Streptomyces sudanensis]MCQ0000063.1 hypothetical protein [Streptomyces sudanensis]